MGFFNPLDVVTAGAGALPGGPGKLVKDASGRISRDGGGVAEGSLGSLGGPPQLFTHDWRGVNDPRFGPQPGGGSPLLPSPPQWPTDDEMRKIQERSSEGPGGITGHGQDPNYWKIDNGPQPVPGMPPKRFDPNTPQWTPPEWGDPSTWWHTINNSSEGPGGISGKGGGGSLQSLGGGPIAATVGNALNGVGSSPNMSGPIGSVVSSAVNQSMVNLRGPDGSMKAVPQSDLAHWLSKGATIATGAF